MKIRNPFPVLLPLAACILLTACATPSAREETYWKARATAASTTAGFNEFLKLDNALVEQCYSECEGDIVCHAECKPMLGRSGRAVADGIADELDLLFVELEGKVADDSYAQEVMTGLGRASALGLRLMLIYTTAETKGVE
jgi:hypothetical protein